MVAVVAKGVRKLGELFGFVCLIDDRTMRRIDGIDFGLLEHVAPLGLVAQVHTFVNTQGISGAPSDKGLNLPIRGVEVAEPRRDPHTFGVVRFAHIQ